jgi:hypothetical protein
MKKNESVGKIAEKMEGFLMNSPIVGSISEELQREGIAGGPN